MSVASYYYGGKLDTPDPTDEFYCPPESSEYFEEIEIEEQVVIVPPRTHSCHGGRPDTLEGSDVFYSPSKIPPHGVVDLSKHVDSVYDQQGINSCTANAVCASYSLFLAIRSSRACYRDFNPSRLFLHFNAQSDPANEEDVTVRGTIRAFKKHGVCKETLWPYKECKLNRKPPRHLYALAEGNVLRYEIIKQNIDHFRACLSNDCPFVFCIKVCKSFDKMKASGVYVMTMPTQEELLRPSPYHTVVAVGYDDERKLIKVLNSWGSQWGDAGYFYMHYSHIENPEVCNGLFWKITFAYERDDTNI
jgi:C1A family cysteine protease